MIFFGYFDEIASSIASEEIPQLTKHSMACDAFKYFLSQSIDEADSKQLLTDISQAWSFLSHNSVPKRNNPPFITLYGFPDAFILHLLHLVISVNSHGSVLRYFFIQAVAAGTQSL